MNITFFGVGYVGLVQGVVFSDVGHNVMCVDLDAVKIEGLKKGIIPIFEPGLGELVKKNLADGRLGFTTDPKAGIGHGDVIFIAVGTPPHADGSADLRAVLSVAESVAAHMTGPKIFVNKSTVPVGSADKVSAAVKRMLEKRGVDIPFDVASNPEFLKEGSAIGDCVKPDRIIIGSENPETIAVMKELYAPFTRNHDCVMVMDVRSAELTKYVANCMLAAKISFMNEMANIAEKIGADMENVRKGIGADKRIGYDFLYPGCGYGGSCFPKDVSAMIAIAGGAGYEAAILKSVDAVNERQKRKLFDLVRSYFNGDVAGRTFALWGLAFKPNTDDMREAPSRVVMESLWAAGAKVRAFDPAAMREARKIYGDRDDLTLCGTKEDALKNADALIVCTDWNEFRAPNLETVKSALGSPAVFDGRNLYDVRRMREMGFSYYGIGRGDSVKE